jgi:hypothetical protein
VTIYDAPDPLVDPFTTRTDRRWRFGLTEIVPLTESIALTLQLQRDIVSSSLPNFAYSSTSVLFGPQLRF